MAYDRCLILTAPLGSTTLQRPVDWNPANNKVEVIGQGGAGGSGTMMSDNYSNWYPAPGGGGGGAGYAVVVNVDPPWPLELWFYGSLTAVFHPTAGYVCYVNGGGDAQLDYGYPDQWNSVIGGSPGDAYPAGYPGGGGGDGQLWNWSIGSGGGGAGGPNGPGRRGNYTYASYSGYVDIPMMSPGQSGFADNRNVGANPGPPPFEFSTGTPPLPYWTDTNLDWNALPSPGGFGYTDMGIPDSSATSGTYPIIDNVTQVLKGRSYGGGGGGGGVDNYFTGYDYHPWPRSGALGGEGAIILSWEAAAPVLVTRPPAVLIMG